jgi:integrase
MAKASQRRATAPQKPRPDFPLFPHARGYWAKKVRGRLVYFGKIANDPKGEAALNQWLTERDDLLAGRAPRAKGDGLTMRELCNLFLTQKMSLRDSGELSPRTWENYHGTCERVLTAFGKERIVADVVPADFEAYRTQIAKTWGPVSIGAEITRVCGLFKYAYGAGLIEKPIRFGPGFTRPSAKTLRLARHAKGENMLEASQLRILLDGAGSTLRAMMMLGLNCGFGNSDVGTLPLTAIDLNAARVDFPRPKTGIGRRCPLWPETIAALKTSIAARPGPEDPADARLVFLTAYGRSWSKDATWNPVTTEFAKLLKRQGFHRPGLGFYTLRHVFETIGGEAKDQIAVNAIMGHADSSMSGRYRERISDERLRAVTDHVHGWLFPPAAKAKRPKRVTRKLADSVI